MKFVIAICVGFLFLFFNVIPLEYLARNQKFIGLFKL